MDDALSIERAARTTEFSIAQLSIDGCTIDLWAEVKLLLNLVMVMCECQTC